MAHNINNIISLLIALIVCVYFLGSVGSQWVIDDEGCRTPNGGVGDCILIKECDVLIEFLKNTPKPLSDTIRRKVNSYLCGYQANTVKVCCPSSSVEIDDKENDQNTSNVVSPPDVSDHRNYKLLPDECGYLPSDDKIVNGQNATLNEFPWMALLSYNTRRGPQFKCGGSIITEKWILTAAHCVSNLKEPLLGVRVGEHNILTKVDCEVQEDGSEKCTQPVQDLFIEAIIPHPDFNVTIIRNDIALLKVARMNLSVENVRPVCLPVDNARDAEFSNVVVTGWGITGSGQSSNILQKVELPVVSQEKCQSVYSRDVRVKITNKQVCAGGKDKKDSCPGDSGGPMHVASYLNGEIRYVQQGIVSFGPRECGLANFPGVYTRIAYYMDWILNTITP